MGWKKKFPFLSKSTIHVDPTAAAAAASPSPPWQTDAEDPDPELAVSGGVKSERLFFDPGETSSSSILGNPSLDGFPFGDTAAAVEVDSMDPFNDFKASMEEMVWAHRLEDWDSMEELLTSYLRVNAESNHGYIIGAFVDVWVRICSEFLRPGGGGGDGSSSFTSPLSFSSSICCSTASPCLSSLERGVEIQ